MSQNTPFFEYHIDFVKLSGFAWILFFLCFSKGIAQTPSDTSILYDQLEIASNEVEKLEAELALGQVLIEQKSYESAFQHALAGYFIADSIQDYSAQLESLFYLTRSSYYLRKMDQCTFYGITGLEKAIELQDLKKQAYFYNVLGIAERRIDNFEVAIDYYNEAIRINTQLKDSILLAKNYNNISACYLKKGDYHRALDALEASLDIRTAIQDSNGMANVYMNMGNNYEELNNYELAFDNYLLASEIYREIGQVDMEVNALYNIGLVYHNLGNTELALEYYQTVRDSAFNIEDFELLGFAYQNIGNVHYDDEEYEKAISMQKQAFNIFENLELFGSANKALTNIASNFMSLENLDSAYVYFERALESSKELNDSLGISNNLMEIGRILKRKGQINEAKVFLKKGISLAKAKNDLSLQIFGYRQLYELAERQNLTSEALDNYKKYNSLKDSLEIFNQEQAVTKIKAQYDFEKQEADIELLNKENLLREAEAERAANQRNLLFVLLGFVAVIALIIYNQFRFSKKKNKIITKEKERSDSLLLNILPEEVAEELKSKGEVDAKRFDLTTVMFTDFADFTNYAENVKPEDVVKSVDYYFRAFDKIMDKYNIEKIKTIGDAYMCVGGLPVPDKLNPVRAVRAALEILKFVDQTEENPPADIHPFKIRIGINSGPVVAGIVGINKFQYDIWGDTVNIAARMETACELGNLNISETTYQHVKDEFPCIYRGEIDMKNKEKLKMYYVQREKT